VVGSLGRAGGVQAAIAAAVMVFGVIVGTIGLIVGHRRDREDDRARLMRAASDTPRVEPKAVNVGNEYPGWPARSPRLLGGERASPCAEACVWSSSLRCPGVIVQNPMTSLTGRS